MAGVIDADGQQWERCNGCGEFVRIESLHYERKTEQYPYGRDLCPDCAGPDDQVQEPIVIKIPHWEES